MSSYRRWVMVLCSTFCVFCLLRFVWPGEAMVAAWGGPSEPSVARIECDEPAFEFGSALTGQTIEHVFTVRNAGNKELEIDKVRSSCNCAVASLPSKTIPPGGSLPIT